MKESDLEQISKRIERDNKTIDREVGGYISTLFFLMQRKILRELPQGRLGRIEALRLLGGLESIVLSDEEIMTHIESLQDIFDLQFSMMEDLYRLANKNEEPPKERKISSSVLAVFVNSRQQAVEVSAREYANEIRQRMADALISQEQMSDFDITEAPVARILKSLDGDLKTAAATFSRMIAAGYGAKNVLYAGPRDARNRPFCAERVNNIYPVEVVYTWDNGQGIPAHLYCGGYGCRHVLIPIGGPGGA